MRHMDGDLCPACGEGILDQLITVDGTIALECSECGEVIIYDETNG